MKIRLAQHSRILQFEVQNKLLKNEDYAYKQYETSHIKTSCK